MNNTHIVNPCGKAEFAAANAAYTNVAASAGTWNKGPDAVLVWATTNAYIEVGDSPTATSASTPIPANTIVLFKVPPGVTDTWSVSAIQIAANGTVYAKPINQG
ncbi:hypothetical protein KGP36_04095 [Patescibacteria group bacterium]|nr:hypothetical protein [Patescibacteria group bacterium]